MARSNLEGAGRVSQVGTPPLPTTYQPRGLVVLFGLSIGRTGNEGNRPTWLRTRPVAVDSNKREASTI